MSQVPTCKEVARPWHGETPIKHATTMLKMLGCPAAAAHRVIVGMHPVQTRGQTNVPTIRHWKDC